MRRILRTILIEVATLYIASQIAEGLNFDHGTKTLLITGLVLAGISLLAKPALKILLLPLNLVTFGVFRWVSNVVVLYIVTLLVRDFRVTGFYFHGFDNQLIAIPAISLSGLGGLIAFALLISLLNSILHWLTK